MKYQHTHFDARIGIGLRAPHIDTLLETRPKLGWLEVHSENWFCEQGPVADKLQQIREQYSLSLHGVGLSLGSVSGIDRQHLSNLNSLVQSSAPILISEHLSWGAVTGKHSNDLLPLPFNQSAIDVLVKNIDTVQQMLGRRILVENLSSYCTFAASTMPEWEFVAEVLEAADCGLLLDINNLYVNACNHNFDTRQYLSGLPMDRIAEVHLAGYETEGTAQAPILVDTHSKPVQPPVWQLFKNILPQLPNNARVLIEWDAELPPLEVLLQQAYQANRHLMEVCHAAA